MTGGCAQPRGYLPQRRVLCVRRVGRESPEPAVVGGLFGDGSVPYREGRGLKDKEKGAWYVLGCVI